MALICFFPFSIFCQQFLQLETINDPSTEKYSLGQTIVVKLKNNDEWQAIKMQSFLYKENIIVLENGIINLDDIIAVQKSRPAVNVLSKMLMTFGSAWLVFGLLSGELSKNKDSGYADLAIGVTSFAAGWGVGKAFNKRVYNIGSRYRLRLIDLRMSVD